MSNLISTLSSNGKRARIHDATLVTKCPKAAKALVNEIAKSRETDASVIVREALAEYFERRGYGA